VHILYAEDDARQRKNVETVLMDMGHAVKSFESGEQVLNVVRKTADEEFDVLITDIDMPPSMNGWQLSQAVRQLRGKLPIIYLSAALYNQRFCVPLSRFLSKPFTAAALQNALTWAQGVTQPRLRESRATARR
jgi:CheY-like chemotaxis protein